jgi:hypothetical protein
VIKETCYNVKERSKVKQILQKPHLIYKILAQVSWILAQEFDIFRAVLQNIMHNIDAVTGCKVKSVRKIHGPAPDLRCIIYYIRFPV